MQELWNTQISATTLQHISGQVKQFRKVTFFYADHSGRATERLLGPWVRIPLAA
jgi:predicted DNA-binding transcriptional regulator YafY